MPVPLEWLFMPERGTAGFNKHQDLIRRMREADPEHAGGWDELGDFASFLARNGRLSKTAKDPVGESARPLENTTYAHPYFQFDIEGHSVVVEGDRVHLTKLNFDLLHYLVLKRNKVVSRRELVEKVWENYASPKTVDVHIFKLRRVLRAGRKDIPDIIRTRTNVGYMLVDEQAHGEKQ